MSKHEVGVLLDEELWQKVRKLAKEDGRSIADYIRHQLKEHLKSMEEEKK